MHHLGTSRDNRKFLPVFHLGQIGQIIYPCSGLKTRISKSPRHPVHNPLQRSKHDTVNSDRRCQDTHLKESQDSRSSMLWQAVSASSWGKDMETLLTTYSAIGKPLLSCCAPIWTPVLSETNFNKIQVAKINSLRTALGCVRKSDIDHLHAEAKCQSRKTATCFQPNSCSPPPSPHTQTTRTLTLHH